jgi:hypothetical protein
LNEAMKDLILLVADKSMERTLQGGLERPQSLGIRPITFDFRQHPGRDGGTRTSGAQILALETSRFSHAMLVLDHEGSGTEQEPLELEHNLDSQLAGTWEKNAKAIVIAPELDAWMWGSDNKLAELLHWPHSEPIREWLTHRGFEFHPNGKPRRPKEALEAIFPVCRMPRSSAIYQKIATNISLTRCEDAAFHRLRAQLQLWFPRSDKP